MPTLFQRILLVAALVFVSIQVLSPTAHAGDIGAEGNAAFVDLAVVVPGLALSMPNLLHVANGRRPPVGWIVTGLVLGAAGAGLSAFTLSEALPRGTPGLAIAGLVGSAFEIALALWGWAQPNALEAPLAAATRLSVAPFVLCDGRSRNSYGIMLAGVTF